MEDIAHAPCAMYALEVLQSCYVQQKSFQSVIGGFDSQDSSLVVFGMDKSTPLLSHQLEFEVQIHAKVKFIHYTVIHEGDSTYVMATYYHLSLGFPTLSRWLNSLKSFDIHTFTPKGYLSNFPITHWGEFFYVDIEFVDCLLDYNIILGHSWTYKM